MTRETIRRWKWIGGGFILLITGILYYFTVRQKPEEIPEPIYETESSVIEISREEEQKVYVHVGGPYSIRMWCIFWKRGIGWWMP